ncbi:MAG: hypothetical protein IPI59_14000 [Sphingobacteriales bacterium]|jgi:hypothetical protein|nr:hypothetical protein [Sphingobacteriales bacterium]MBP9142006.1 hypothetical protein [Chitinophagales bacterium]MDA0197780.1 hypothetical protein [Bacteroidota bacterium]MBK6888869.1 hypothetical protein [Sphingobacteriales bacterium]MBK7528627.1 hypothetical protein [Sphingobacteriales bacterium]
MEIVFLPRPEIDTYLWDKAVVEAKNAQIYGLSWFLDAACALKSGKNSDNQQWAGLVAGNYQAVMPLPIRKKMGISYVYQPDFVQQLGAFFSPDLSAAAVNQLSYQFLQRVGQQVKFADIMLNEGHFAAIDYKENEPKTELNIRINSLLPLQASYEVISRNFSGQTKRMLRRFTVSGLPQPQPISLQQATKLYQQVVLPKLPHVNNQFAITRLLAISKAAQQNKAVHVWGIPDPENSSEICASVVFLLGCNRLVYWLPAALPYARQSGALYALVNKIIQIYAGQPLLSLDFEGSMQPGIARFFANFGANTVNYAHWRYNNLPYFLRWLKK